MHMGSAVLANKPERNMAKYNAPSMSTHNEPAVVGARVKCTLVDTLGRPQKTVVGVVLGYEHMEEGDTIMDIRTDAGRLDEFNCGREEMAQMTRSDALCGQIPCRTVEAI
jgi:hypothetical protein